MPLETEIIAATNGYIKIENSIIGAYSTPASEIDPSNIVASQIGTLAENIDPKLGTFDALGKFFPLQSGSPAIGTEDGTLALVEALDQVGNPRSTTGPCNMGSVEVVDGASTIEVTEITLTGAGDATTITTKGGTLQMHATALPTDASDATVTWSVNDEAIATIDADGLLTAVSNGDVTVTATANDGTGIKGILVITVTNQDTSVWESTATTKIINIYPNPASTDILYLQNAANAEVAIYSITGQIIIARSNTSQVNIQDLEPGIYFVRINAEGTQQTRKLIRE